MHEPDANLPLSNKDNPPSTAAGDVIISDVIGKQRSINIFAGFTRDLAEVSQRLENGLQNTTVLAPLNSEMQKLPRKPWEDPDDRAEAFYGADGDARAQENLKRFVGAHIIPRSPWKEGEKVKTIGGGTLWWESKDGKRVVRFERFESLLGFPLILILCAGSTWRY